MVRDFIALAVIGFVMLSFSFVEYVGERFRWTTATQPRSAQASSPSVIYVSDRPAPATGVLPICSGGNRAERRLTCIVDGDTGWHDGINWRLVGRSSGVDAPEISKPECSNERRAGDRSTARLREMLSDGYDLVESGTDRYGRVLARITLADGRDAGDTLVREGHAQEWPNSGNPWCR